MHNQSSQRNIDYRGVCLHALYYLWSCYKLTHAVIICTVHCTMHSSLTQIAYEAIVNIRTVASLTLEKKLGDLFEEKLKAPFKYATISAYHSYCCLFHVGGRCVMLYSLASWRDFLVQYCITCSLSYIAMGHTLWPLTQITQCTTTIGSLSRECYAVYTNNKMVWSQGDDGIG